MINKDQKHSHILVVDDDNSIRELVAEFLVKNSYLVSTASSPMEASSMLEVFEFDLIILDVLMPEESGIEFLAKNPPELKNVPVLMLSALGNVDDRINGLENGANDYLAKPFEPRELILRIKNLLSRSNSEQKKIVLFGDYKFYIKTPKLEHKNNVVYLTTNEIKFMQILSSNLGKIVSRDLIMKEIGQVNARTIDVQIARLRSKIETNPKKPNYLCTIRNQGYVLHGFFKFLP